MLDATHIEEGKFELEPTRFHILDVLVELTESFTPILSEAKQTLTLDLPEEPIEIFADQTRMSQVISNLVTNASKYSPGNTEITVVVESDGDDGVEIRVADQGIGIDPGDVPHVFAAFFRADNEGTRAESGTGIGLYFCKTIGEFHSGNIAVTSKPGEGKTVTIKLPREFTDDDTGSESTGTIAA